MNVNVNLAFLSLSILYIAFLNVIFLKKGHIKTFELDTFGKLITLNLIGILLEFGCIFTIKYSKSNQFAVVESTTVIVTGSTNTMARTSHSIANFPKYFLLFLIIFSIL